jgi:carbonic anhydrase/acetyltransferase-like protein (isoleucine patch superfamily)
VLALRYDNAREVCVALYRFEERRPTVAQGAYVSDSARVIGDVIVEEGCYIGHGVILRGDYGSIRIGAGTAVEENAVVHIRPDGISLIGKRVTIGHGAVIHGNRIADSAVIGMGAVICFDVEIGEWCLVGEGCVVPNGERIPAGKVVMGIPARIVGDVQPRHKEFWTYGKQLYIDLAKRYPTALEKIG